MTNLLQSNEIKIAVIGTDISYIKKELEEISRKLDEMGTHYLTITEFLIFKKGEWATVRNVVYGLVSLILTSVIAAGLFLMLNR